MRSALEFFECSGSEAGRFGRVIPRREKGFGGPAPRFE
jgi:hypothetical protein